MTNTNTLEPIAERYQREGYDARHIKSLLTEANRLLRSGSLEAALLIACATTEAGLREAIRKIGVEPSWSDFDELIQAACANGLIKPEDRIVLERGQRLRNTISHGFRPEAISAEDVRALLEITRMIYPSVSDPSSGIGVLSSLKEVTLEHGIRRFPDSVYHARQATIRLEEVVRRFASEISAEWDQTSDRSGHPVIILRLSDSWGAVTATFSPDELKDPSLFRPRFTSMWSDLLAVRSERLRQKLDEPTQDDGE